MIFVLIKLFFNYFEIDFSNLNELYNGVVHFFRIVRYICPKIRLHKGGL